MAREKSYNVERGARQATREKVGRWRGGRNFEYRCAIHSYIEIGQVFGAVYKRCHLPTCCQHTPGTAETHNIEHKEERERMGGGMHA